MDQEGLLCFFFILNIIDGNGKKMGENMVSRSQKNKMNTYQNNNFVDESNDEMEIDLMEIWRVFKKHIASVFVSMIVLGVAAFGVSSILLTPKYESNATIFLTPKIVENVVDYNSMSSNQKLVNNVVNLMTQDNLMNDVADKLDFESGKQVKDSLTVSNIPDTELITVSAVTKDPQLSKKVVSTTLSTFIQSMEKNLNVSNIEIVDSPILNDKPVSPNIMKNTVLGVLLGFVLACARIVIIVLTDKTIKTKTEAERFFSID